MDQKVPDDVSQLAEHLADRNVKFLMASFSDMHGVSKTKIVPLDHIAQMMAGSELYTGAALDGVPQDVSDEEVSAHPDPNSVVVLPWQPDVAWFASDLWCEGKPFEPCARNTLKRQLQAALDMGYAMKFGMEAEFFVFKDTEDGGYEPLSTLPHLAKPAYDATRLIDNLPWISDLVTAMNGLGWGVYSFDHEDGIGQFEIDFNYADALTMADRYVFFRFMANSIARRHGAFATFMPKPLGDRAGSGAHFNISFADPEHGPEPVFGPGRQARQQTLRARLPLPGRRAQARACDLRRLLADGEQLQAADQAGQHVRLYLGAGVRLLRQQQPHQLAAYSACRRTRRAAPRRQLLQSLPGRSARARRRARRHSREN